MFFVLVCDRDTLLDIISNTSVKCSEDALSVTGTNKTEKYECPICQLQILPNLCKEPRFGQYCVVQTKEEFEDIIVRNDLQYLNKPINLYLIYIFTEKCKSLSTLNRGLNEENDDRQETMDAQSKKHLQTMALIF